MRTEIKEDEYLKGLLVCTRCWDPDHPQRYPAEPRPEQYPPLRPAPDQFKGPSAPILSAVAGNASVELSWTWPPLDEGTPDPSPYPIDPGMDGANILLYTIVYRSVNGGAFEPLVTVDFSQTFSFPNQQLAIDTTGIGYEDTDLTNAVPVSYYVVPYDAENNVGTQSNTVTVTPEQPAPTGEFVLTAGGLDGNNYSGFYDYDIDGGGHAPGSPFGSIAPNNIGGFQIGLLAWYWSSFGSEIVLAIYGTEIDQDAFTQLQFTDQYADPHTFLSADATYEAVYNGDTLTGYQWQWSYGGRDAPNPFNVGSDYEITVS